jgi:hypothetical protein
MRPRLHALVAALLLTASPARAHRLDEYLQAVTIAIGHGRMQAQLRLTPGVAVYPIIFRSIDSDGDGILSRVEETAYALRVLRDLSFTVDGAPVSTHLISTTFASAAAMKDGRGDIVLDFDAALPAGAPARKLTLENRHQRQLSVYLVNALVPTDTAIRIAEQIRNNEQSYYRLDFEQAAPQSSVALYAQLSSAHSIGSIAALLALTLLIALVRWNAYAPPVIRAEERLD